MSNYYNGCYVAFEYPIKDEDIEPCLNAIKQLRFVADAEANVINGHETWTLKKQIKQELREKFLRIYNAL